MNEVGLLIVTYNRLSLLKEEIASIREQSYQNFDIIVVNNCSTDDTKSWLKGQYDIQTINIEPQNIGPARAFVTGMKYICEKGYMYCWLMDDDVECHKDALKHLVAKYKLKDDIGFVCSRVIGTNGNPMNVPLVDMRKGENGYSTYADMIDYKMIKVSNCTFVSLFISCKTIFEKGLPYGEFYNWMVDTEYGMRLSLNNSCYCVYDSIVIHKRIIQKALSFEAETDQTRLSYYRSMYRNSDFILIKYAPNKIKQTVKCVCRKFIDSFLLLLRFKLSKSKIVFLSAIDLISFNPIIKYPEKAHK